MIKCGKVCFVCCDYIVYKIVEDYGEMFIVLIIGEFGRCIVEFLVIFVIFGDIEMKMKGRRVIVDGCFVGSTYFLVLFCFLRLLIRYLRLFVNLFLNLVVKCVYSNVRGIIKMIESG